MTPVNIIIPVYKGLKDVQDCLESVYSAHYKTDYEIIVIDDCSPEPAVSAYLKEEAAKGKFTLLINEENLGFVATVNRGMQQHPERDVLLLNSDTVVANDWLDRIVHCAYASDNVGTVTPFSNNATICSYPNFCQDNAFPKSWSVAELDQVFARCNAGESIDIPTGVGFCMFIRRACLDLVGYFDVDTFGKGYGEENDFCQRVIQAGWCNKFALDTFVLHTGNVSFGDEHNDLKHAALGKLTAKHPTYDQQVQQHIFDDKAKPFRERVWLASLKCSTTPIIVHVSHNRGGGTLRFLEELSDELKPQAASLMLKPSTSKPGYLTLSQVHTHDAALCPEEKDYCLFFHEQEDKDALLSLLANLPIGSLHYHHLIGLPEWIKTLGTQLSLPWFVSLHDYYMACPQVSLTDETDQYCKEKGIEACNSCIKRNLPQDSADIVNWRNQFRDFLTSATLCFAPSEDTRKRFLHYFPEAKVTTVYHQEGKHLRKDFKTVSPQLSSDHNGKTLNVLVIGALSKIKGADLLENLAVHCKNNHLDIQFTLTGYAYRNLLTLPDSHLHVEGRYNESNLLTSIEDKILNHQVDAIWFTALWPETFSYTLSTAIESGLPIIAPDIGAFPERLYQNDQAWIVPWESDTHTFATVFLELKEQLSKGSMGQAQTKYLSKIPSTENSFHYKTHYLALTKPINLTKIDTLTTIEIKDWIDSILSQRKPKQSLEDKARVGLLNLLYTLRGMKILRRVVKLIPHTLQRRIKEKLVK
ncbi:glycosyltransferase [Marinomonas algicola]|uniref:glycosyltransferase n=1 Tax=Marinomonas algicola TaxID=2773454 RepID=UPI00174C03B9|nr:glycosyltransferase [Marinomonas algicola]